MAIKRKSLVIAVLAVFVPATIYSAVLWTYTNDTNIVATDEFLIGSSSRSGSGLVNVTWPNLLSEILSDGDFQSELVNKAGLYSALSDATQFYEPGDLLRTQASNTPTTLSTSGEFNIDSDDEQFKIRVGTKTIVFDFSGDGLNYSLKSNGSGFFTLGATTPGSAIVLDLTDDDVNESSDINEFAVTNDTNNIVTEGAADKVLFDMSANWPTCDTSEAGDSATGFFPAGTIEHERGGLEANVSAYDGLVKISGGSTSAVTVTSYAESILDDTDEATVRATLNLEPGVDVESKDSDDIDPDRLSGDTVDDDIIDAALIKDVAVVILRVLETDVEVSTGDGIYTFTIPEEFNTYELTNAHAIVYTASSSGTPTFQIYNVTDTQDMLSTEITIDASALNSYTATTPPVINTSYDDVATGDQIRIDCDVAGTDTAGLDIVLTFTET
jgi:hypothetical protein